MSLAIKRVVNLKQKAPSLFEMRVRLADGTAAVVLLSTLAFAELIQHGNEVFRLGVAGT